MSKCQEFLEGRKIESVEHEPGLLRLRLDDGATFEVGVMEGSDGFEITGCSLDFGFEDAPEPIPSGVRIIEKGPAVDPVRIGSVAEFRERFGDLEDTSGEAEGR